MTEPSHHLCDEIIARFYDANHGELRVGGLAIRELADRFGTPFYVYDQSVLEQRLADLKATYGREFSIFYSMKANPDSRVVRFFSVNSNGIEVASVGELEQAIACGCHPANILFAGPGKTMNELRFAIEVGVGEIHVESWTEIQRIDKLSRQLECHVHICLRVNPAELQGGAMRMGGLPAQFGIDEEQLDVVIDKSMQLSNVHLQGVHLYVGTQILDANLLLILYERFVTIADHVADRANLELTSIDFGGGLGIPYYSHESQIDLAKLAEGLPNVIQRIRHHPRLKNSRLIIEPGRFLTAEAGIYVTRVIDIKMSREEKFVIVDGGLNHHLAASGNLGQVIKRNFPVACLNRLDHGYRTEVVHIVGPLCTPLDRLARAVCLPEVRIGDLIGVFCSGAYGRSASPLGFLSHPAPAEVFVSDLLAS